jgi:hypothetical protein
MILRLLSLSGLNICLNKFLMNLVVLLTYFMFEVTELLFKVLDGLYVVILHSMCFLFPFLFIVNFTLYYVLKVFNLI